MPLDLHAAKSPTGPLGKPIGLQIFTLRSRATSDFQGTLTALAEIGYREIEWAGNLMSMPAAYLRKLLAGSDLACPSIHFSMSELQENPEKGIRLARDLGAAYLVCSFPWTADDRFKGRMGSIASGLTLDDWKWNAEQLNRIGALAQKAGLRLGYHNHNIEFRSYDGVIAFDELLRLTDPSFVTFELDIAWVVTAGADPIRYLRDHASRVELLHVKDVRKDLKVMTEEVQPQTTEIGNGRIDWSSLFAAMDAKRIRHYFVEQENFERPELESVRISFDYLRRLGTQSKP